MKKVVVEIAPQGCGQLFSEYGSVVTNPRILFDLPER